MEIAKMHFVRGLEDKVGEDNPKTNP